MTCWKNVGDVDFDKLIKYDRNTDRLVKWPIIFSKSGSVCVPMNYAPRTLSKVYQHEYLPDNYLKFREGQFEFLTSVLVKERTTTIVQAWNLCPGFGKSVVALYGVKFYNIPTLIIVHSVELFKQWNREIVKYELESLATVCMVKKVPTLENRSKFLMVIMDEVHVHMTDARLRNLFYFQPEIFIGLTATLYRYDEHDVRLYFLFGKNIFKTGIQPKQDICVFQVSTGFHPTFKQTALGRLDWNSVLKECAESEERNKFIIDLVYKIIDGDANSKMVLLCKRIDQVNNIFNILVQDKKFDAQIKTCVGTQILDTSNVKILVATYPKIGLGVSLDTFNVLVLCTDIVNYSNQYFSRVIRNQGFGVNIYDLVDVGSIFNKHWLTRLDEYKKINAIVKKM